MNDTPHAMWAGISGASALFMTLGSLGAGGIGALLCVWAHGLANAPTDHITEFLTVLGSVLLGLLGLGFGAAALVGLVVAATAALAAWGLARRAATLAR